MSKIDISIETKNKVVGKVSTKKKIDANIYPRGPQGPQGIQGPRGETGNGIANIEKTNTIGLVDTYTITFTNGTTFDFNVTNANAGNTYTKSEIEQFLAQKVNISDIINTLTSDETNKPLSAKQGKVLKGLIDNTYTSSEIDAFLSTINSNISNLNDTKLNKTVVTDAYSSSNTYAVGDYCIYGNTLYKCTTAISTAEAWNSLHWTATTVTEEIIELANDTNIVVVESYLESGLITAKKIANLVIVTISGRMQNTLQNTWTDCTVAKLNGITSKYEATAPIVDQNTGLCADILISANSNEILINKRAVSSITGEWLRGQLLFIAN